MKKFKNVYVANPDGITDKMMDSLIMCSSSNWDYYFSKTDGKYDEKIENISLVSFDDEEQLSAFLKNNSVIDYSVEHEKPCVLKYD